MLACSHWSQRQLSAAWVSWRAGAAQLRLLSRFVSRARSGRQAAALTSWVSAARDLAVGRRRQMAAVRALRGSNERRAWMSWVSRAAELAAMLRVMRRTLHRSVWWALSTWRDVASARSASLTLMSVAVAHMSVDGSSCRWALYRWMLATERQLVLLRPLAVFSRQGERRALNSWLSQYEHA